jgi:hypothetical protein
VNLDIRIPIGLMFGIIGAVMTVFGLLSDPKIYHRSLGYNVNVGWGCVLMVFAAVMLALAYMASRKAKK